MSLPTFFHYDRIFTLLDEGRNLDVIYLDFVKAFGKLDFDITLTLAKLSMLGIIGKVGKWLHSAVLKKGRNSIAKN